jgi:hypothetical protein
MEGTGKQPVWEELCNKTGVGGERVHRTDGPGWKEPANNRCGR